jgi:hypothetical protein
LLWLNQNLLQLCIGVLHLAFRPSNHSPAKVGQVGNDDALNKCVGIWAVPFRGCNLLAEEIALCAACHIWGHIWDALCCIFLSLVKLLTECSVLCVHTLKFRMLVGKHQPPLSSVSISDLQRATHMWVVSSGDGASGVGGTGCLWEGEEGMGRESGVLGIWETGRERRGRGVQKERRGGKGDSASVHLWWEMPSFRCIKQRLLWEEFDL